MKLQFSHVFTNEALTAQLDRLGAPRDGVVLMHSSLRAMTAAIALMLKNSGGIDPLEGEAPIPQAWYCVKEM